MNFEPNIWIVPTDDSLGVGDPRNLEPLICSAVCKHVVLCRHERKRFTPI